VKKYFTGPFIVLQLVPLKIVWLSPSLQYNRRLSGPYPEHRRHQHFPFHSLRSLAQPPIPHFTSRGKRIFRFSSLPLLSFPTINPQLHNTNPPTNRNHVTAIDMSNSYKPAVPVSTGDTARFAPRNKRHTISQSPANAHAVSTAQTSNSVPATTVQLQSPAPAPTPQSTVDKGKDRSEPINSAMSGSDETRSDPTPDPSAPAPPTSPSEPSKIASRINKSEGKAVAEAPANRYVPRIIDPWSTTKRNASGSSRFVREDIMIANDAARAFLAELIDEDWAIKLSEPWHEKGVLDRRTPDKYLDPSKKSDLYIPSMKHALWVQKKKDEAMLKFIADWRAGIIDEDGNPIVRPGQPRTVEDEQEEPSEGDTSSSEPSTQAEDSSEDESDADESPKSKPETERPTNELTPPTKTHSGDKLATNSPSKIRPIATPTLSKAKAKTLTPKPVAIPTSFSGTHSQLTTTRNATTRSSSATPLPSTPAPDADMEEYHGDYSEFDYFSCAAICRSRSLKSGGNTEVIRARLIKDDQLVRAGQPRVDQATYENNHNRRNLTTVAPLLKITPKRKRDDEDGDADKGNGTEDVGGSRVKKARV
jgi:hypothetical protein